jgi:hypothetical protein
MVLLRGQREQFGVLKGGSCRHAPLFAANILPVGMGHIWLYCIRTMFEVPQLFRRRSGGRRRLSAPHAPSLLQQDHRQTIG